VAVPLAPLAPLATSTTRSAPIDRQLAVAAGGQVALLAALAASVDLGPVGWLAGLAYAVGLHYLLARAARRAGTTTLGPADLVTLGRAALVAGVTALVAGGLAGAAVPAATLIVIASVALALDAVDGRVARRTGTASALGARFDMEVDAFLILVLSVHVAASLGPWVLLIGTMRYGFVAAARVLPWLNRPLPESMARKTVAAVQGIALLVVASGILPRPPALGTAMLALALLGWSFGRDVGWLWRAGRRAEACPGERLSWAPARRGHVQLLPGQGGRRHPQVLVAREGDVGPGCRGR
jgi:phosphatidylglycerophosphate synthase